MSTAYERLADSIRQQILSGELRPGDRLPREPELSAYYKVSRNTAREALRALASQGLVKTKRGVSGGTFVAIPSKSEISESLHTSLQALSRNQKLDIDTLIEVRGILELPAAELAATRATDEQIEAIRLSLFNPDAGDVRSVAEESPGFHWRVFEAAGNPLLTLMFEPLIRVITTYFDYERSSRSFWKQVDEDHREILDRIAAHDPEGARVVSVRHLELIRGVYEQIKPTGESSL